MKFQQSFLESQLLLNQEYERKMMKESEMSGNPDQYKVILESVQKEILSILEELQLYNH